MNHLANENSPYLLQHKNNPVNWFPWCEEAFQKAIVEDKPIFLSIGYATCHWCHVMAHESFEDLEIAALMNNAFVNIKVDREERPDIDSMYMTVCQMINGQGGWPLTIIMTPEKKPFFAATYIPKDTRFGLPGLRQLIPGIVHVWKHERENIRNAIESIEAGFAASQVYNSGALPGTDSIDDAAAQLVHEYDEQYGGFGSAPKFPSPYNLIFLLRQWHHTRNEKLKEIAEKTLTAMRLGGIWDHIGFGFHRYSTDERWLVPHFEKMLYDQALLIDAYTEGWQATGNSLFEQTVREIIEFVFSELRRKNGGFYTAIDADSDKVEGKYYLWTTHEINRLLKEEEAAWFGLKFHVEENGNFEHEDNNDHAKMNIPHLASPLTAPEEERFSQIRQALLSERKKRTPPITDNKILTDQNAMMISALAKAGTVFRNKEWISEAEKSFRFLTDHMIRNGVLNHNYVGEKTAVGAFADDFAFLIKDCIDLYTATFDVEYLQKAIEFNQEFVERFWDADAGGFFFTDDDKDQVLGRQKHIFDDVIPSSNSIAMLNLLQLGRITGNTDMEERANKIGKLFSNELTRAGSGMAAALCALQFVYHHTKEIIIAEGENDPAPLISLIQSLYYPQKIVVFKPAAPRFTVLEQLIPYITTQKPVNNNTAIYICTNYICEQPLLTLDAVKQSLNSV